MFLLPLAITLKKEYKYVISVSGGVDSMTLLDYLYSRKFQIIVVHFNHLKRERSYKDKVLVNEYCQLRKIPFYYFELSLENKNFQNQASLTRKLYLQKIAVQYKTRYIVTAHHLNEGAKETYNSVI
ncbi:MAG: ATP-binding protein [Pigeon pea little leaf phytoplasma]|uniref:7-cyano-7-deazaguanine synthase n=1 Tax=Candidatus Phytoplasma fabacearum TaxID=2982628 RepID=A0ABU8ZT37_9MOLU|nr:ATP-binding protein ['Bituminaria bituminosa' little leaf phytoplasma]MDV3148798.1 ATP-binding protein [Pigeon pea little leaf phytoplasma]MDO7983559.1 7-cyano-7-deazaguanine synthase ['Bituminaria bituminosa' little leaf phytoplasma]MDO8023963.1 7-cyano-7-deazaguanine synthase ['Bituminaria bituminosa' little leaf phytoplasma]MDO8030683.1 7-cyano-7-deazaguanine synthase ['Bituminaria bituminosa' little leaf phytoplasma]MDV3154067.1 ATP-binding protein [Pigeon pea little leaf phytoplasma]